MKKLDELNINELVTIFNNSTLDIYKALEKVQNDLEIVSDKISNTIKNKGRVIYVGAGSSGRIGLVDALDVIPTFNEREWFKYSMAGGDQAILNSLEGFEDDWDLGYLDAKKFKITQKDLIVGLSASGNTRYVKGFFDYAKNSNAYNILIENKTGGICEKSSNYIINIDTGPEIIDGSTRLKSATAQKIILNMFSSIAAIKNNKVYDNLMIEVTPINEKLILRSYNIISKIVGASLEQAKEYYKRSDNNIKIACIMFKLKVSKSKAGELLKLNDNNLRKVLENDSNN
ncbi:N-acetylmuramic acid 6-phosphate etherase [Mycoplasmopsis cynos]|uniref:N-acetylmuramic acid 6-phosphate etherase n=2 Tax=Mycoplasmopsis cynos TaxID=171284 RepID=A0A449AHV0_9BACT|nr:N-acetylmuramic acid 6-phosphate etherase [Mycoplasmopsis cynos]TQC54972.1 N-acetylmuramic acid 6-phosphate etherase [Mycoplasmopsis cynos]WQQ17125.1 N-acetylmuramic acid 6-phosphate etherase [Mycoplasmopsis cynos]WQQ19273.1 N-acetylmuramic acid 6-phosphate etherase [Mycoplasmopsis cynos]VEU64561.1 N-acetylmuramic acid 6-phosphate etherase [Mycoplasmopsis cynos]